MNQLFQFGVVLNGDVWLRRQNQNISRSDHQCAAKEPVGIVKSMASMVSLVPALLIVFSNSQIWVGYCLVLFHSSTFRDFCEIYTFSPM